MKYLILTLQATLFFWFVLVATVAADTGDEEFYSFHGHYIPLPADQDKVCLAKNIYFEAANQSFAGKLAVSHVVINRVMDKQFPDTICDVVYQGYTKINWKGNEVPIRNKCQFSWYCDGLSDEPVDSKTWAKSLIIAEMVLTSTYPDITEGALWYHADYILPYWADELEYVTTIDQHIFYK
jgi:spore germination cell wall hydrolase CwlJ-like protein